MAPRCRRFKQPARWALGVACAAGVASMSRADEQIYSLLAQCAAARLPIAWLANDVSAWELIAQLRAQLAAHEARASDESGVCGE